MRSTLPSTTTSGSAVTKEEFDGYRTKFQSLQNELGKAGLTTPINRKALAYLLSVAGETAAEQISKVKWEAFFKVVDSARTSQEGIKSLVPIIEEKYRGEKA